jgi:hypothetical protein
LRSCLQLLSILPCSDCRDPLFPGLSIYTRRVIGILVFECVVRLSSQTQISFGAQYLLQSRDGTDVPPLVAQPTYGLLSHASIRV